MKTSQKEWKNKLGVYIIKNILNDKCYIGSSCTNLYKRLTSHYYLLNKNKHNNKHLQRAFNKDGEDNFIFEILEYCSSKDETLQKEEFYIELYKSYLDEKGYNIFQFALTTAGNKWSDEAKLNRQGFGKGKTISQETKKKMSISAMGRKMKEVSKQKLRDYTYYPIVMLSLKGEYIREFKNCTEASLYFKLVPSGYVCSVLSGKKKTCKGYRLIKKDEYNPKDIKEIVSGCTVEINQYDLEGNFIKSFLSFTQAEKEIGIKGANANISACCRGKYKYAYGYKWKYKNNNTMIDGKVKNEREYRETLMDSSSSLKMFATNRRKYYKVFIEKTKDDDDEDTKAMVVGMLVETLLLDPWEFDNRFYMSACAIIPSGLMGSFCEALYKYTIEATNEQGVVMRDFADISQDAYVASGFKIKYDAVIQKFAGIDAEIYFNEILKVRQNNLTVVTTLDVTNAEKIVEELRTNFVTKDIVNLVNSDRFIVLNQLQVEGYTINGLPMKSMIDKCIVDTKDKVLRIWDLKCSWSVEGFFKDYFLYRKSYIQAYVYHKAIQHYRNVNYPGYSIQPIGFIVCDSTNYYNPLIYQLTFDDLKDAEKGFEYKGTQYQGVASIIEELLWAQENNIWGISKENYLSNGVVPLKK